MDKKKVRATLENLTDWFGDFYITQDNLRLNIKENLDLVFECIDAGDKIYYDDNAVLLVVGYSDNAKRKYIKLLSDTEKSTLLLLEKVKEEINDKLYVKLKKKNPLLVAFEKNGYRFFGNRGKEVLLIKEQR